MPSFIFATKASVVLLFALCQVAFGAPIPMPQLDLAQISNANSGAAGKSMGGSIIDTTGSKSTLGGLNLLNILSHNAGKAGDAQSGAASAGAGTWSVSKSGTSQSDTNTAGNASSGEGGTSEGGSISGAPFGLIDIFSGNAGDGASASSGPASSGTSGQVNKMPIYRPSGSDRKGLGFSRIIRSRMH